MDNRELPYPERPPQGPQPVFGTSRYPAPPPEPQGKAGARYREAGARVRIAFFATLLFLLLSQPATYRVLNSVYNALLNKQAPNLQDLSTEEGFPTVKGLLLGGVLFFLVLLVLLQKI